MRILLKQIENTYNNGSLMLAINTIQYLAEKYEGLEFYTDTVGEDNLQRIKSSVLAECKIYGVKDDNKQYNNNSNSLKDAIKKKGKLFLTLKKVLFPLLFMKNLLKTLLLLVKSKKEINKESARIVIYIGGDDLSPYYGYLLLLKRLIEIYWYSKKSQVFLVGQTMGPFNKLFKIIVKRTLSRCQIYTREELNYRYLKDNIGLMNVKSSSDLAFLDLPGQNNLDALQKLLDGYGIEKNKYVVIVPSGLVKQYSSDRKVYIENYLRIIRGLLNVLSKDVKLVLLNHVEQGEYSDRIVIEQIVENMSDEEKMRVVKIVERLIPVQLRSILGNAKFTITGRMHAAVSSFQMNKPAISISYSIKYKGVIGDGLGYSKFIVEANDDKEWKNFSVSDSVLSIGKELVEEKGFDDIRNKEKIFKLKENCLFQLSEIGKHIDANRREKNLLRSS